MYYLHKILASFSFLHFMASNILFRENWDGKFLVKWKFFGDKFFAKALTAGKQIVHLLAKGTQLYYPRH